MKDTEDTWQTRTLDGRDEELARRLWELGRAADTQHRPYDVYWSWENARLTWGKPDRADMRHQLVGAFDGHSPDAGPDDSPHAGTGARLCGWAEVALPLLDNTHLAFGEVYVHPDHQRRGAGTALVDAATRLASEAGRSTFVVEAYAPPEEDSAGLRFARALGFEQALVEGVKRVDLVATEPLWEGLEELAASSAGGYRIVTARDAVPDDLVEGYCQVNESFNDEAPSGELDLEREHWDVARVRDREARNVRGGRAVLTSFALSDEGEVVGFSEAVVDQHTPDHGAQSGTLVVPGHRGHRLGLAMKLANHRALRAQLPDCLSLFTGNAGVNAAMNAVNDLMGYVLVERCVEVQKALS